MRTTKAGRRGHGWQAGEALRPRALLVSMPFASAWRPSLAVGLLQASLRRRDLHCDAMYLNVQFAKEIGLELYSDIAERLPTTSLLGEWIFAREVFGEEAHDVQRYEEEVLDGFGSTFSVGVRARIRDAWSATTRYLERCSERILAGGYDVVGFTTSFQQSLASLALAKRLKEAESGTCVVFGGANCESTMGIGLARAFPFIDYVCLGEGDSSFADLVERLGADEGPAFIGNIVGREALEGWVPTAAARSRVTMDALPVPTYDAFVDELRAVGRTSTFQVPIELSRGCWWGAKHHCTFCGLNGTSMTYTSKSPERALVEMRALSERHGPAFMVVDNIIALEYLTSLFPELAADRRGYKMFVEAKANLRKDQMRVLAAGGVETLQLGIESLSTHVLKLMRKGTTMLQNVQTLKWCAEHGVQACWNILTGFPGEHGEDYTEMLRWIPRLHHLAPPFYVGPVRVDRFSPFHTEAESFGLRNLRPLNAYSSAFALGAERIAQLAYYFTAEYATPPASEALGPEMREAVQRWQTAAPRARLTHAQHGAQWIVRDSRADNPEELVLTRVEAAVLQACDGIQSTTQLAATCAEVRHWELTEALERLLEAGLLIAEGDKFLALSVPT